MKFFLDENMPLSTTDMINNLGFAAEHAKTVGLRGANDAEIAKYAKEQQAILITKDLGFGSVLLYPKGSHYGVLILRVPKYFNAKQITKTVKSFLTTVKVTNLIKSLTVLELGKYRVRTLEE